MSWISRRTDPTRRIVRSIESDHIAWIEPGHGLGQTVSVEGEIRAVSVDLVADAVGEVKGRFELCRPDGTVLAAALVEEGIFRWDRSAHFLKVPTGTGPGEYLVRVSVDSGRLGWRTLAAPERTVPDDGVSPLPVRGAALRDGVEESGVRALGVETVPAPNPVYRKKFTVDEVRDARLSAVGLGYGMFSLNGTLVTEDVLEPAQTDYRRTILYRAYDVTHLLRRGENTLVAEPGRGFYAARGANTRAWNLAPWHREPVVLAQLEYVDGTGRRVTVATGSDWETAESAVAGDLLHSGETTGLAGQQWEPAVTGWICFATGRRQQATHVGCTAREWS